MPDMSTLGFSSGENVGRVKTLTLPTICMAHPKRMVALKTQLERPSITTFIALRDRQVWTWFYT